MIAPTARHALGEPARSAISPYVATRPDGMRRTADSTRRWNCEMTFTMTVTLASDVSRPSENSKTAEAISVGDRGGYFTQRSQRTEIEKRVQKILCSLWPLREIASASSAFSCSPTDHEL